MPVAMPEEEEEEEPDYIPKASKRRSRDVNDDYEVEGREDAAAREAETNDLPSPRICSRLLLLLPSFLSCSLCFCFC